MKHIIALLFASLFSMFAIAQPSIPEPTPLQKWGFLNGIVAVIVGPVVLPAAMLSGQRQALCDVMKGKYDPAAADQCRGGQWVFVIPYLKKATGNE